MLIESVCYDSIITRDFACRRVVKLGFLSCDLKGCDDNSAAELLCNIHMTFLIPGTVCNLLLHSTIFLKWEMALVK